MSSYLRKLNGLSSGFVLAGAFAGCTTINKWGLEGCAGDTKGTSNVQTLFNQHPELGAPGEVGVQTIDHVVYLDGFVASGMERGIAGSVAQSAPGVTQVVNSIAVTH